MPGHCCVPECRGNYDGEKTVRVFTFPSDPTRNAQWIRAIPREDFIPGKRSVVRAAFVIFLVVCELLWVHILALHVACLALASNIHSLEMCVCTPDYQFCHSFPSKCSAENCDVMPIIRPLTRATCVPMRCGYLL